AGPPPSSSGSSTLVLLDFLDGRIAIRGEKVPLIRIGRMFPKCFDVFVLRERVERVAIVQFVPRRRALDELEDGLEHVRQSDAEEVGVDLLVAVELRDDLNVLVLNDEYAGVVNYL